MITEQNIQDLYVSRMTAKIVDTRLGATTSTRIKALRKEEKQAKPIQVRIMEMINDTVSIASGLFSMNGPKNTKMCDNYGHVINYSTWDRHLPRCSDCNKVIDDPKSLRRSSCEKIADPNAERWVNDSSGRWSRA